MAINVKVNKAEETDNFIFPLLMATEDGVIVYMQSPGIGLLMKR